MDYLGPESADFANVRTLNAAFLKLLRNPAAGRSLRRQLPRHLRVRTLELGDAAIERFCEAPFLLMSFREQDEDFWRMLGNEARVQDLFHTDRLADDEERLVTAGLGFLWELTRRNPFSARLVSGASIDWCERIAGMTLLRLVQFAVGRHDLLALRFSGQQDIWEKLLGAGLDDDAGVRAAAYTTALHAVLTTQSVARYQRMRAAACKTASPLVRVHS